MRIAHHHHNLLYSTNFDGRFNSFLTEQKKKNKTNQFMFSVESTNRTDGVLLCRVRCTFLRFQLRKHGEFPSPHTLSVFTLLLLCTFLRTKREINRICSTDHMNFGHR